MGLLNYFGKKEKVVKKSDVIETPVVETPVVVEKPKKVKAAKSTKSTNPLVDACYKAVEKTIAKDHHDEAKEIIDLSSTEIRNEFLKYFKEDNGNICCLVLDKAKRDLIAEGKLGLHDDDAFGKPFLL